MSEPLAHSGDPPQTYADHVGNVRAGAEARGMRMLEYHRQAKAGPQKEDLLEILTSAATYHDLGKLDPGFQQTLENDRTSPDHIRHEDAGVARLLQAQADEAAGLVSAHHQGLVHYKREIAKDSPTHTGRLDGKVFRIDDERTQGATARRLDTYLLAHAAIFGEELKAPSAPVNLSGLTRRLLLSCLVDADHSDTAQNYGHDVNHEPPSGRWLERLAMLDLYVAALPRPDPSRSSEAEQVRQRVRDELYRSCRKAVAEPPIRICEAVVGSGKTTALMAHLLSVAATRHLRHIIIVLPYTNIIRQTVEILRKALSLEGEDPKEVIAEHHHQSEYDGPATRYLTTLWRSPIIVTTAVQFFGTLASNRPSTLRKLHELPGAAVCLDEAHAALPTDLWPVCWNWLREWVRNWSGHLVLASGSLPRFWELDEFQTICRNSSLGSKPLRTEGEIPSLSPNLKLQSEAAEHRRVRFVSVNQPFTAETLVERIELTRGPRIVVVNTVQSAAFLAALLRKRGAYVLHLSTALTPAHRDIVIQRIINLLKYTTTNWTLVATSLVEAGLNFSFSTGFRQRASAASLIQLGGRVNRNADRGDDCTVYDFDFSIDRRFPDNPSLRHSKEALTALFEMGLIGGETPCDLATVCLKAMKAEFRSKTQAEALAKVRLEVDWNYPEVADECQVIRSESHTVVVDPKLVQRLQQRFRGSEKISALELMRNSVKMYTYKISKLAIERIPGHPELCFLPERWRYDPDFLGYMANEVDRDSASIPDGYYL